MSYQNYLLKVGGTILPTKYIFYDTYEVTPEQYFDLDPYRNANGQLMRNVLPHAATTIKFSTKPMWGIDFNKFQSIIRSAYISAAERKLNIEYYDPEYNSYKSGTFYIADNAYGIMRVDNLIKNDIFYKSKEFEFIEY